MAKEMKIIDVFENSEWEYYYTETENVRTIKKHFELMISTKRKSIQLTRLTDKLFARRNFDYNDESKNRKLDLNKYNIYFENNSNRIWCMSKRLIRCKNIKGYVYAVSHIANYEITNVEIKK